MSLSEALFKAWWIAVLLKLGGAALRAAAFARLSGRKSVCSRTRAPVLAPANRNRSLGRQKGRKEGRTAVVDNAYFVETLASSFKKSNNCCEEYSFMFSESAS